MDWSEFVDKLEKAKKKSLNNGLSVPCIANLIYAGAFDSMLESQPVPGQYLATYGKMFEDVRHVLKSKAGLPKKTKTIPMGLDDIRNDIQLGLWRFLVNPMSKFDFTPFCRSQLEMRGFADIPEYVKERIPGIEKNYPMKHDGNTENQTVPAYLVNIWDDVYESRIHPNIPLYFRKTHKNKPPARHGCLVGVVVDAKRVPYGKDGKRRLVIDFYNGYQLINGIVVWPDYRTNDLPRFTNSIRKMSFGVLSLIPKSYKGRKTAQAVMWEPINVG